MTLWQITLRRSCFGVVTRDGTIVEAASIAGWSVGKPFFVLVNYVYKNQGQIALIRSDIS